MRKSEKGGGEKEGGVGGEAYFEYEYEPEWAGT